MTSIDFATYKVSGFNSFKFFLSWGVLAFISQFLGGRSCVTALFNLLVVYTGYAANIDAMSREQPSLITGSYVTISPQIEVSREID